MHEEDYGISKITSTDEMNVAVSGVYARLAQYINNYYTPPQYLADDMPYVPYTDTILYTYYYFRLWYTDDNWQKLYNIITSANNIICQFQNNPNIKTDMRVCLGEVYLIRAYAYFRLVRIFGTVPIVDNIQINSLLSASSIKDVYTFIESDLLKAANYLPISKSSARIPNQSPTRGSAKAMLAEVYLTMGGYPLLDNTKYFQAAQVAKKVMDSAAIYGFNLLPDYANLWDGTNMLNNESLFGLFFSTHGTTIVKHTIRTYYGSGFYYDNTYYTNNFSAETTNDFSFSAIGDTSITYVWDVVQINPKAKFFSTFPISYRKDITFQNIVLSDKYAPIITYDSIKNTFFYTKILKYTRINIWNNLIFYKKFGLIINFDTVSKAIEYGIAWNYPAFQFSPDSTSKNLRYFSFNMGQPIYIYRYAHTLLTYAEAKVRSGQLDASAYEAVNMIRRRANKVDINSPSKFDLQPGLSATQFADSVVQERAWEFCAEPEGRWFDLVRCEMIEQLPKLRGDNHTMTKSDYFDAVPDGEKVIDPNLK